MLNALTIDVEDYFQVSGFERQIRREDWASFDSRVERNTDRLLEVLDDQQVRGTFFVLGWTAERHPEMVRRIQAAGHEIGSHSYWHRLVYDLTHDEFRNDLRRSRDVLESITGQPVRLYRAPSFSITKRSLWAFEILAEEGFEVDSSVYPVVHDRYGIPDAALTPHPVDTPAGAVLEVPPAVTQWGRFRMPTGGGGYFRLLPWFTTRHCLARIHRAHARPFVFYLHPWEIDPEQPRLSAGSKMSRFRHYANLHRTQSKLVALLRRFRFGSLSHYLRELGLSSHESDRSNVSLAVATP